MAGPRSRMHPVRSAAHARMKLVLFDIDGTILWTDGAGRRALHDALVEVFGSTGPADHRFDGKTDPQIVREMMRHDGHADVLIDEQMARLFASYLERLRVELRDPAHPPKIFPGVRELLHSLGTRPDIILGLLTGNLVDGARAKLEAVNIDPDRFAIGAFGSDHELRPALPAIARGRAEALVNVSFHATDIVVIGDTPADMTCGRDIGARAVGVATGRYTMAELLEHGAYAAFEDLSDTPAVIRAITAP